MKTHAIYNLECSLLEFDILGYHFVRVDDYEQLLDQLFKKSKITLNYKTGNWVETQKQKPGTHICTYTATFSNDTEAVAKIHNIGTPLIFDICLLWSLWGGMNVCTGAFSTYKTSSYYGYRVIKKDVDIIESIQKALTLLIDHDQANKDGLIPSLLLLNEAFMNDVINFNILFISPIVDLLSSKIKVPWDFIKLEMVNKIKKELTQIIANNSKENDKFTDIILKPFLSNINNFDKPRAADKLFYFLKTSPAIKGINISDEVLYSHAKAFNQIRNSTLHYAGIPESIDIRFDNKKQFKLTKKVEKDTTVRAMVYYTFILIDLLQLHFLRYFEVNLKHDEEELEKTLKDFYTNGLYNDADWMEGAFKNTIEQIDE